MWGGEEGGGGRKVTIKIERKLETLRKGKKKFFIL